MSIILGNARHIPLRDGCVQCVVTSPPYWGLRDYKLDSAGIGLESTPELYVQNIVEVFSEVRRVLRDDGTVWLNMGDSYAGASPVKTARWSEFMGSGGKAPSGVRNRNGLGRITNFKPKDLMGMPWRVAFALQADDWWLRSDIVWSKINPMPEGVVDRPMRSHEYVFLLAKSEQYFYDASAITEPAVSKGPSRTGNKRDVWTIPTETNPEQHYASFPQALVMPCILAGTSAKGCCAECGAPLARVTETSYENPGNRTTNGPRSMANRLQTEGFAKRLEKRSSTLGWRLSCSHNAGTKCCLVLDPFFGSGTVGIVAERLGRHWVGLDLSSDYIAIAKRRTAQQGLFLKKTSGKSQ